MEQIVNIFRVNWHSQGGRGKRVALLNSCRNIDEVFREASVRSCGASTQRALHNPNKINLNPIKTRCYPLVKDALRDVYYRDTLTRDEFIEWEYNIATLIRTEFRNAGVDDYTYGNAQKWINLAIKYVLSSNLCDINRPLFKVCFFPLDRIIQIKLHKILSVDYLRQNNGEIHQVASWGNCDNWDYIVEYQNNAKAAITNAGYYSPLFWEIINWNGIEL